MVPLRGIEDRSISPPQFLHVEIRVPASLIRAQKEFLGAKTRSEGSVVLSHLVRPPSFFFGGIYLDRN